MTDTQALVAQAIRIQRVRAGISSDAELARRVGMTPSALSKRLSGDLRLNLSEVERIAGALAESRRIEEEELVAVLLDKARDGETTWLIFALKSRHGYRDQGAPQAAADARVNVVINLPAASASAEEYARTIDGSVAP